VRFILLTSGPVAGEWGVVHLLTW